MQSFTRGTVDTTGICLARGISDFTVSLRFSSTYTFPSFRCLGPLLCASADLRLRRFTIVPLSLALPLLTLVPRPLAYLYYIILVSTLRTFEYFSQTFPQNPTAFPSRFRSLRAPCSSPAFPTPPHASAAFVTLIRRVSEPGGHPYGITRHARECATTSDLLHHWLRVADR